MADDRHRERENASAREDAAGSPPDDLEALDEPGRSAVDWSAWSHLWQVPAILLSGVVILAGLYVAVRRAPENDFDGALAQIEQLLAAGNYDLAAAQLNDVVEPNLHLATPQQQARFHSIVADWIAASQAARGLNLEANNRRIVKRYGEAAGLGGVLSSGQLERWAAALLALGDLEGARSRLAELEDLAAGASAGLEVRRARNRVLRGVVELTLRQRELPVESLMQLLAAYRGERLLVPADELWAIGRQAELRLETGDAQKAIDHLLVDMRRFEPRLAESQLSFSELLTLLGRAYYDLGNYRHAGYHVERALEQIDRSDPVRGDGLALLGQIAVAKGEWHDAFELFDEVVRNYSST